MGDAATQGIAERAEAIRQQLIDPGPQSPFCTTRLLAEYLRLLGHETPIPPARVWKDHRFVQGKTKDGKEIFSSIRVLDFLS
jgi:hypothetical protein